MEEIECPRNLTSDEKYSHFFWLMIRLLSLSAGKLGVSAQCENVNHQKILRYHQGMAGQNLDRVGHNRYDAGMIERRYGDRRAFLNIQKDQME